MNYDVDFKNLEPITRPNYYLVCPKDFCNIKPQQISPIIPMNIQSLMARGEQIFKTMPRTRQISHSKKLNQYQYVQKSLIFRFPDFITIRYIELDNEHSTMAILSRAKYGYSDFGVNKKRVQYILKSLTAHS